MSSNPLDQIATKVPGIDLWQPRDWPHRSGDEIRLDLLSFPLTEDSPGRRSHACENCGGPCLCIHDNVMCWKCKGAFCFHCTVKTDPNTFMHNTKIDDIVDKGFAKCPKCQEPLRSIAMIDVFRGPMESIASGSETFLDFTGSRSLVQEAESALSRGLDNMDSPEQAILEFTHSINAINYVSSMSGGSRLVLRAFDILLIGHACRAQLEDNQALFDAILNAYPRASVKTADSNEKTWYLSESAYKTLFYPLQANLMVGSRSLGGLVRIDLRTQSKERAFECDELKKQVDLSGYPRSFVYSPMHTNTHPHCDGLDTSFDSLNGVWRGLVSYLQPDFQEFRSFCEIGTHSVTFWNMVQFIHVFPTNLAATEYARIKIMNKNIGEEDGPLQATESPQLTKMIKRAAKALGVQDLLKIGVIKGQTQPAVSVMAAVGNVATKIFIYFAGSDVDDASCYLAAKSLAYLERQLKEFRKTSRALIQDAPHYHPDLTVCTYCGKGDEESLKTCSRCKLSKYCSVACQTKHWEMKGQFGHTNLCKSVAKVNKRK